MKMDLQQILNAIGLTAGIVGAFIVFINSPKVESFIMLHSDEEINRLIEEDKRKNQHANYGVFLIGIGFVFQLIAVLIHA